MAMPADLSPSNSPKSQLNRKVLPSPWTQVVRGAAESEAAAADSPRFPLASDNKNNININDNNNNNNNNNNSSATAEDLGEVCDDNDGVSMKSAWKAVNGGEAGGGAVMGTAWPSISESTRPSSKSSSKSVTDGSVSIAQEPVISHVLQKQANANDNSIFTPSQRQPHRQRSMKRGGGGGGGGGSGQSGFVRPPLPPPPPPLPPPFPVPFGNMLPPVMELPVRAPPYKGNNWETRSVGSHSHMGNDHGSHRQSSRRGNFGSRPRVDGVHHNNHGGKRDQDRDWNNPRNSTATRDVHMHQLATPPTPPPPHGFTRPALPGSTLFIPPQHVRPFVNRMPFDMVPPFLYVPPLPPEPFRGVPLVALPPPSPPPPMFFPVMDPNVHTLLLNQIDYYFSDANLVKDNFLRSNMDDQGWVPISLIASFPRAVAFLCPHAGNTVLSVLMNSKVLSLTSNVQLILDTLGTSTVVEVQGDKLRKRDDWKKWVASSGQFPVDSGLQVTSEQADNMLATSTEKLQLDDVTSNQIHTTDMKEVHAELVQDKFLSEQRIALPNGEDTVEASHV